MDKTLSPEDNSNEGVKQKYMNREEEKKKEKKEKENNVFGVNGLPPKSKSFFSNHQGWFSNMLASFVATVLGIAVTIGVSKYFDYKENKEVIKVLVFNALYDLDNYEDYLKRTDDSTFSKIDWLQEAIDSFRQGKTNYAEPLYKKIIETIGKNNNFYEVGYSPSGKELLSSSRMNYSIRDLETFRIIYIAYEKIDNSYSFLKGMKKCVNELKDVWHGMECDSTHYENKKIVYKIVSHKSTHRLNYMMKEEFEWPGDTCRFFKSSLKTVDYYRRQILDFSGIDEEEYNKFRKERRKKEE